MLYFFFQEFKLDFKRGDCIFFFEGKSYLSDDDDIVFIDFEIVDESEFVSVFDFDDVGDELFESDDVGNVDDFVEYGNMDEIVFLEYMDEIIFVLKVKCEE